MKVGVIGAGYWGKKHVDEYTQIGADVVVSDLIDENLKGIDEWFERQNRYSTKDAKYELEQAARPVKLSKAVFSDAMMRRAVLKRIASYLPFRPMIYFIYTYIFRLGFLDGRDGLTFCLMKAQYQRMVAIKK